MSDAFASPSRQRGGLLRALALPLYIGLLAGGAWTIMSILDDLDARRESVKQGEEQLARLRAARGGDARQELERHGVAPGAAFLAGEKQPVAAAELQRRVATAVVAAGGNVVSSQYDKSETTGRTADVELNVECDIDQPGLRKLLYDLESTTPFVYVDKLNTRVRGEPGDRDQPRLRVSLRLAAVWLNPEP